MIKILLNGYAGKMGRAVAEAAAKKADEFCIAAGADIKPAAADFPVFEKISDCGILADVIIDFTWHDKTTDLLEYAKSKNLPAVVATTGHTPEELEAIKAYAESIAVFKSPNMSLGVYIAARLAKKAAAILKADFDIEIIEKHHNQKLDAPSGTALMLAEAVCSAFDEGQRPEYVYDRHIQKCARGKRELGIHSIRGGSIIGEHEVIFAGQGELISISHSACSRDMFASGALSAAKFLLGKPAGLYTMDDYMDEILGEF